jgi:hypothetical protein
LKAWARDAYEAAIRSRGRKKKGPAQSKKAKGRSLNPRDLPLVSPRKERKR